MTATADITTASGAGQDPAAAAASDETAVGFDDYLYDSLLDGLLSGRLGGVPYDHSPAQVMLSLLQRLDWAVDTRRFAGALPHFPERFGIEEIRATMAHLGFTSEERKVEGTHLRDLPPATIVLDMGGGLGLLDITARGRPVMRLPATDRHVERRRRLRRNRTYRVVGFEPSRSAAQSSDRTGIAENWTGSTWRRFAPELRLMLGLTLLSGLLTILTSFVVRMIFDAVVPAESVDTLLYVLAGLGGIFALDMVFRKIKARCVGRVSGRMEFLFGSALFGKLLRLPGQMVSEAPISDQMARLRQFETVRDLFGGPYVSIAIELPLVVLLLAVIAVIAWPLALMLLGMIVIFAGVGAALAPAIRRESRRLTQSQTQATRLMLEALAHRRQIGRDGLVIPWLSRFETAANDLAVQRRRLTARTAVLNTLAQASLPLSAAAVIGAGTLAVMEGDLTGGQLVAATILCWRLIAPVQQALMLLAKLPDMTHLLSQIDTMMRLPVEDRPDGDPGLRRLRGQIKANAVSFRFPRSVAPALMNVNLKLEPGGFLAVTGNAGSGKTTLLKVLAGQLSAQSGEILLDDLNVAQLSRGFRAANLALVGQSPLIFYGTIEQNLRFADPAATTETLNAVLEELGLAEWVAALPRGLATRIDPDAQDGTLPASVKLCLAVAQAFLREPAVLLLDEPAGGLDPEHEAKLLAAIRARSGRMSCVMVTHRPSILRSADAVLILNRGTATFRQNAPEGNARS